MIKLAASTAVLALAAMLVVMVAFEPFAKDESEGAGAIAIDFGSNLSGTPIHNSGHAAPSYTTWNGTLPAGSTAGTVSAPISGVVVSFTLKKKTGFGWAPVHLRVVRPSGGQWGGFAASTPDVVPSNAEGLETFPVRLTVQAGDYVALETDDTTKNIYSVGSTPGSELLATAPKLPAGGTPQGFGTSAGNELLLQARVEPDGDGDGYGDVTQDACPLDAGAQAEPCPVQPTTTTQTAPTTQPTATTPPTRTCPKGKKLKRGKCVKKKRKKKRG